MAVEEGLIVTISADASQVGKSLKDLQAQLKRFQDAQKDTEKGTQTFNRLQRAIDATTGRVKALTAAQKAANAVHSQSSAVVSKSSASYTNFGRVIQDLPFGFTAIQNNLTQLIPSVGALGLAFSGIIAAITFAQVGFGAWTRGFTESGKEIDATREKLKQLIKPIEDIRGEASASSLGDISVVKALVAVVKDQTKSYGERNRALKELGVINKSYFGDLTLEEDKLKLLTSRVEEYTKALVSEAIIKAFSSNIGDLTVELAKQQNILGKTVGDYNKYSTAAQRATKDANSLQQAIIGGGTAQAPRVDNSAKLANDLADKAKRTFEAQRQIVSDIAKQKDDLTAAMQSAVEESLKLKPLTEPPKGPTTEKQKTEFLFDFFPFDPSGKLKPEQRSQLLNAVDKFSKDFGSIFQGVDFRAQSANEEGALQSARDWWDAYKKGIFQFNPKTFTQDLNIVPTQGISDDFVDVGKNIGDSITKGLAGFDPIEDAGIFSDKTVNDALAQWNAQMKAAQDQAMAYATTVTGVLTPALQGMFQAIVQGANPIKAFLASIGQAILQLIAKLIAAAVQAAILSALLPGGFSMGGNLLKGFGDIFKGLLGFAQGGIVSGPVMAMIGEGRGTSKSNPEIVTPLDKLKGLLGNTGGGFPEYLPAFALDGDTLRAWYARANKTGGLFG